MSLSPTHSRTEEGMVCFGPARFPQYLGIRDVGKRASRVHFESGRVQDCRNGAAPLSGAQCRSQGSMEHVAE